MIQEWFLKGSEPTAAAEGPTPPEPVRINPPLTPPGFPLRNWTVVIADSNGVNAVAGLFSVSSSNPTLPAGYDQSRRIGTVLNNSR